MSLDQLLSIIQSHVEYAPYLIFATLLLAGFNLPVSEDTMLFIAALLASQSPHLVYHLFAAVFLGAYLSDLICYGIGRLLGPRIWKIKFLASIASAKRVDQFTSYFEKYGPITLFVGRFIPFGVRNALFITAALGKMDSRRFAFYDFLACTVSCTTLFSLYYRFGRDVVGYIQKGNMLLFVIVVSLAGGGLLYWAWGRRKRPQRGAQDS